MTERVLVPCIALLLSACGPVDSGAMFSADGGGPLDATTAAAPDTGKGGAGSGSGSGGASGSGAGSGSGSGSGSGFGSGSGSGSSSGSSSGSGSGSSGSGSSSGSSSGSGSGSSSGSGGTSCAWGGGPTDHGNGELTCYWFGQGTSQSNGSYKTACGYLGTESGTPSGNQCGQTSFKDSLGNIADPTYFAAYPDNNSMNPMNCGLCAEISYGGRSLVATIVDDCATCANTGHLDLSMSAANALGLTANHGDVTGVTWRSVPCLVSGDIVALFNNGYGGQVYFQNVVFPVASARSSGHGASYAYGYWDFGTSVAGQAVTLTDALGHSITGTLPASSGGSIGAQFPRTCQ